MKKLVIALLAIASVTAYSSTDCSFGVITSNFGKEFDYTILKLEKAGYVFNQNSPNTLYFSSETSMYNKFYKIMRRETEITLRKEVNNQNQTISFFRGKGVEVGTRVNRDPWKKSVKEALVGLPNCTE